MTKQKCFLVCNAHLDPVWLWPWEEGLAEAISTFRVAADFLDEHPEFVFNHNESLLYEWVERNDPELFARIREHVASGRWHPAGGAYLQPDLIAASGESVIRQFLLGQRYFAARFGVQSQVAHNFDTFGHPQGMARLLAGCGFVAYVFCRPGPTQKDLPVGSFRWRHASGAEIVARRSDDHYITQGEIRRQMADGNWPAHYAAEGDFMFLWGLGNHGGGASRDEYAQFPGMRADFPEVQFIESTTDAFFAHTLAARDRDALPVVTGDLNQIHEGCYTSMFRVKQAHRRLENLAHLTEKLCAAAWWQGRRDYPATDLEVAWKDILFCEFHDVLPGSGIPRVEADALNALGHAEEILRRKKAEAVVALLRDEPRAADGVTPFFLFNPFNWEVTREVEMEYGTARQAGTDGIVRTLRRNGEPVDAQFEKGDLNLDDPNWGEWRQKAVFRTTIPPLSWQRFDADFRILPRAQIRRWQPLTPPAGNRLTVTGPAMTVTVNSTTGLVDSVVVDGREQVRPGAFRPAIFADIPHSWNAAAKWVPAAADLRLATPAETADLLDPGGGPALAPVRILEDGPVRTVIEALFVSGRTSVVQRYRINKHSAVLEIELDVFWAELEKMLKLGFTPARPLPRLEAEKCYSIDDETDAVSPPSRERTFQHFLRLVGDGEAIGVVSHGTHAYHREDGATWLSVLRSPAYGCMNVALDWRRFRERHVPHHDQGERQARFTVVFGAAAGSAEAMARRACEDNVGLEQFVYYPTRPAGPALTRMPFLTLAPANVILATMKKAEDGEALILRLWEVAGRATDFALAVDGRTHAGHIGAHGLQTLRLDRATGALVPTDLLERPQA